MSAPTPDVSIVIPNLDGAYMLAPCLERIASLDYPCERLEVFVVDNGSRDESRAVAARSPLSVTWIDLGNNRGFAAAANEGARRARGELVAFLNNDVEIGPDWITQMVEALSADPAIGCVASPMVDRDGTHVDFFDAAVNFHGFADQPWFGMPVDQCRPADADLPFACGGAMLMPRELFLQLGGFDERFFAYFEDVDLGWRIRLHGRRIVMASAARARHRHGATSRRMAPEQKTLLLERNALLMLIKNVAAERRDSFVAGALMLLIARALDEMGSDRRRYDPFEPPVWGERVPANAIARLHAAIDVLEELPAVLQDRETVQRLRRRDDDQVLGGGATTGRPIGATSPEYVPLVALVASAFGLDEHAPAVPLPAESRQRVGVSRGWLRDQAARRRSLGLLVRIHRRFHPG